jgi:hypothetical protein
MKTLNNLWIIAIIILLQASVSAQTIPNPGFENWTKTFTPAEPTSWISTNVLSNTAVGKLSVTKSTDHRTGNYSVKMKNVVKGSTSIPGGISYSSFAQVFNQGGGVAYTSKPDSISFSYKCNIAMGDTGHLVFLFKNAVIAKALSNNGAIAGIDFKLTGTKNTWHDTIMHLSFPLDAIFPYSLVKPKPDTLFVAALATDLFSASIKAGNFIMLDNIKMVGNSVAQIPNNDFENWDSTTIENANGWYGANDLALASGARAPVTKSSDSHSGNFAIQIKTEAINAFGNADTLAFATTGIFGTGGIIGGIPYSTKDVSMSFYYKYTPAKTGDTANAVILLKKNGHGIDTVLAKLPPASSFTFLSMNIPVSKSNIPDSLNILFSSSHLNNGNQHLPVDTGSTLLIDDIAFSSFNGMENKPLSEASVNIFPNPANGTIYLQYFNENNELIDFTIFNSIGQEVLNEKINIAAKSMQPHSFNIAGLPRGLYIYSVKTGKDNFNGKLIINGVMDKKNGIL